MNISLEEFEEECLVALELILLLLPSHWPILIQVVINTECIDTFFQASNIRCFVGLVWHLL